MKYEDIMLEKERLNHELETMGEQILNKTRNENPELWNKLYQYTTGIFLNLETGRLRVYVGGLEGWVYDVDSKTLGFDCQGRMSLLVHKIVIELIDCIEKYLKGYM